MGRSFRRIHSTAVRSSGLYGLLAIGLGCGLWGCVSDAEIEDSVQEGPDTPDPATMNPVDDGSSGSGPNGGAQICAATLSVSCDGQEDCESGEVCCGIWDAASDRYTAVECRTHCEDDAYQYELCHPDETCRNEEFACRNSEFLPEFLFRCLEPLDPIPMEAIETQTPGAIRCGNEQCGDDQQCCVRPPHLSYCVPRDVPCTCQDPEYVEPSDPDDSDAGTLPILDAGIDSPDAGFADDPNDTETVDHPDEHDAG